jgi:hypothetical protein
MLLMFASRPQCQLQRNVHLEDFTGNHLQWVCNVIFFVTIVQLGLPVLLQGLGNVLSSEDHNLFCDEKNMIGR